MFRVYIEARRHADSLFKGSSIRSGFGARDDRGSFIEFF